MGAIKPVESVKLIVGVLSAAPDLFSQVAQHLTRQFGPIDHPSPILPFEFTSYYEKEMGQGIKRQFFSFEKLIKSENLARIKIWTNQLEVRLARKSLRPGIKRPVNLDPGYLTASKLVLASTKDYSHRIYLSGGIYAEVTLRYLKDRYQAWPWTYPDYQTADYLSFFQRVREIYLGQRKTTLSKPQPEPG